MLQKSMIMMMSLTLLTAVACNSGGRKLSLSKSIATSKNKGANTQNKDVNTLIAGNKDCLPLYDLVKTLTGTVAADPGTTAQKGTQAKAQPAYLIYINSRSLLNAGSYGDDPRLNLALLVSPLEMISEMKFKSTLTSSKLIGSLLIVTPESNCSRVVFPKPSDETGQPQDLIFTAQTGGQAQGRLSLINPLTGETREYRVDDTGNLVIDVTVAVPGVAACDGKIPRTMNVRTTYKMNVSGLDTGMAISTSFGKLLSDNLVASGITLPDAKGPAPVAPKPGEKTPPRSSTMPTNGIPVTSAILSSINTEIQSRNFKEISCKKP
ncbi:MAG: hypothetical protein ACXVA9_00860 [Bdellovibrionales bacterium]